MSQSPPKCFYMYLKNSNLYNVILSYKGPSELNTEHCRENIYELLFPIFALPIFHHCFIWFKMSIAIRGHRVAISDCVRQMSTQINKYTGFINVQ